MTSQLRQLDVAPLSGAAPWAAQAHRLAWGFVALGVVIRLLVYLMRFPLWVDECTQLSGLTLGPARLPAWLQQWQGNAERREKGMVNSES